MFVDEETGLLSDVVYISSQNCNQRPNCDDIDLIVLHGISLPPGEFGGEAIIDFFTNQLDYNLHPYYERLVDLKVSSHLLIRRDGEIIQFVPFLKRAWHAGKSQFLQRENCNDFSIGIELEGTDDIAYERQQYQSLRSVVKVLMQSYPKITKDRIVVHCNIAPGRKTDPGPAFDWNFLNRL